jgi:hypothetical protein
MTDSQQSISTNIQDELQIHLTEYEKLREEMMHNLNSQDQKILLALGSASIAVPLLVGQTGNVPANIVASLLYTLAIIYAVLGMNYVGNFYSMIMIGKYIHEYIEPAVNQIVKSSSGHKLLYWESFLRRERRNVFAVILAGAGVAGSALLLLLPGAIALLAAQCVLLVPTIQTIQQSATLQLVSFLLTPLAIIAWFIYLLAVGSCILILRFKNLVVD